MAVLPDADLALKLAAAAMGARPVEARRFMTGFRHFVFEAIFADRPSVVVRIATEEHRAKLADAVRLLRLLRPLGVPMPALIAEDTAGPYPYMILERLPGKDLGEAIDGLSETALDKIAAEVVAVQKIVATLPTQGRYGYAASAEEAPYEKWSQVLEASLAGSRERIEEAGFFSTKAADAVAALVRERRQEIDAQDATPFLHDTTTKNVIVTADGAFSGIVDVDNLCFGDPRYAAALTMASLLFHEKPLAYVEAWCRHASFAMDHVFRIYVGLFLVNLMSRHGQTFNKEKALALSENEKTRLLRAFKRVFDSF
jgi:aminoglycoside phosphotransferase (APT) family kinase protein